VRPRQPDARDEAELELFGVFAAKLVTWNVETEDGPVAADLDGVLSQESRVSSKRSSSRG